ncbi:hypothetical protein COY27_03350 [Candidatus Woesearchaeota archaeon CG_4_10_14_0_2_um_filter_33_13]|nr:MAG: hypothetical protein COY27_03350 [Candidatus Woesearchaeota archaeon CG_4_10_14_0_2_um_filter_33_13]
MINPFKKTHWIANFPPHYPFYKKVVANLVYFFTGIIIHPRHNLLTHTDLIRARLQLKKGDIALLGNLRETSSFFIKGAVTHTALFLGNKEFIHAVGDGVEFVSLHHLFTEYDTIVILRLPHSIRKRRRIIKDAIKYAKTQLGKPYDFEFTRGIDKIFCTELINESFKHAGHDTKLKTFNRANSFEERILKLITSASLALRPEQFLESNFDIVFLSHNLKIKKKLVLKL